MSFFKNLGIDILKSGFTLWSKTKLPTVEGDIKLSGIRNGVEIIRDQWGIPHIYASSIHDVLYAQGFVHAQDRLWQMDLTRRAAQGRLSEFIGKDALEVDRMSRTLGFKRVAEADMKLYDAEQHALVESYCNGINAYLKHTSFKKPIEFSLVKLKPSNFEPIDVLSISRLLTSQMSWGWYDELVRAKLLEIVGEEGMQELDNTYLQNAITLPKGIEFNQLNIDHKFKTTDNYTPKISGSNAWTISGNKTTTGQPFLCNDPHLAITNPNIWYEIHLDCPELKVTGVSIPGTPLVPIGHNENIAWGITLSFTDIEDLVIEKFTDDSLETYLYKDEKLKTEIFEEEIKVKGETKPFIEKVYQTKHGVIVSDALNYSKNHLALQSMAFRPNKSLWAWYTLNISKNWDDFKEGVSYLEAPGLNIVFADVQGNIGYYNSGKMPIKTKASASVPTPGWTGESDWNDFVPFDQMPHAFNPEKNYVVTCNNKNTPADYPYFLGDIYMNGYRAERLEKLIHSKERLGIDDFTSMQQDIYSIPGLAFAKHFANLTFNDPQLEKLKSTLVNWDGLLTESTIGGTLYEVTKEKVVRRLYNKLIPDKELVNELLGKGYSPSFAVSNTFLGHNTGNLLQLLVKADSYCINQYGSKETLLKDGFQDAIQYLTDQLGNDSSQWQWSKIHQMEIPHALSIQKPLDKVFGLGPFPIGGDTDTPFQTYPNNVDKFDGEIVTASYRQIIDMSNFDNSLSITPGGQSGNLASPFYASQINDWLKGKFHPMCWSRASVDKNQKHLLRLEPK
ncbi:MAG: penicillin acylase family protein [Chitinophagales bacterium]